MVHIRIGPRAHVRGQPTTIHVLDHPQILAAQILAALSKPKAPDPKLARLEALHRQTDGMKRDAIDSHGLLRLGGGGS